VPITGQIVNLEGRPVQGATLRVMQINAAPTENLGPWVEAVNAKKGLSSKLEQEYLSRITIALSSEVTTDAEGRFRLTGIGRNRLVAAQLDGPTIVSEYLHILTRPGKAFEVLEGKGDPEYGEQRMITTYYGAGFRHVAAPTKPIVGVVHDKDTKKPLGGITIRSYMLANRPMHIVDIVQTTTDAEGRYRLTGMPKGKGNRIMAVPGSGQPYVVSAKDVPDSPGLDPVTVDVELKQGVLIEGKITDKVTGKPVQGNVEYFALYGNPNLSDYDGFDGAITLDTVATKEDGSYRVAGLPGPGLVAVVYSDHYLRATERDDEHGIRERSLETAPYHLQHPINYSALGRIDPAKGVGSVKRDITLDPGWMFTGTVLGLDGKPLVGSRGFGLDAWGDRAHEDMKSAEFTVREFNPRRPRSVLFQHLEKGLIGVAQPPKHMGDSITVQMQPGANVTGRLIDSNGQPRAGVELEVSFRSKQRPIWSRYSTEPLMTDRDGRFHMKALLPGYDFRLSEDDEDPRGELVFGAELQPGQTKDLGDVRLTADER